MENCVGFQRITTLSGEAIIAEGTPLVLYGFNVAAQVTTVKPGVRFYEGDGSDPSILEHYTTADIPTTVPYPEGITFPNGCLVDVADSNNVESLTVFYKKLPQ